MDGSTDFKDAYEHIDPSLLYTPVNIPGPGVDPNLFDLQFEGCSCMVRCGTRCPCVSHGATYHRGRLPDPRTATLIYECHGRCSCSSRGTCSSRLVQEGPLANLEIFQTERKGHGLKCRDDILTGTFVCEYAGEVISHEEAKRRFELQTEADRNYIFALREHFGDNLTVTYIDPMFIGNVGRYINHSCNPNLSIVIVRTDTVIPKLCLFANQDIKRFTELSFDYGEDENIADTRSSTFGIKRKLCLCGEQNCRVYLPCDENLLTK